MLHLSLATIDAHNLKESIIGFVAFPLFIDSATKRPLVNSINLDEGALNSMPKYLHRGNY